MAGRFLFFLYGVVASETVRSRIRKWILTLEGGAARSLTIRRLLWHYHRIEVGLHSMAPCMARPQVLHPGTRIGRYSILADSVRTFTRDHPMDTKSSHGVFYNPMLGRARSGPIVFGRLDIGNGVRIGHEAIILRPTGRIGDGAVIGPGAVVYGDVPPYAVVQGNPAAIVGYRYPAQIIEGLLASRWWERSPD